MADLGDDSLDHRALGAPTPPAASWAAPQPGTAGQRATVAEPQPSTSAAWTIAAQVGLGIAMLSTVYFLYAVIVERAALVDVRDGETLTFERADRVDNLVSQAAIAHLLAYVAAGIMFIGWFFQSYRTLSRRRLVSHKTGWAIGSWFVPILNCWRPYQIARELATQSPRSPAATPGVLRVWWGLWLAALGLSRVASRWESGSTLDAVINADGVWIVYSLVDLMAAGAALVVVRRIARAEAAYGA